MAQRPDTAAEGLDPDLGKGLLPSVILGRAARGARHDSPTARPRTVDEAARPITLVAEQS